MRIYQREIWQIKTLLMLACMGLVFIISSSQADDLFENQVYITTHNSYSGNTSGRRGTIWQQLDYGARHIEFDIRGGDSFNLGHTSTGHQVYKEKGNPDTNELKPWIELINDWSDESANDEHVPLVVMFDGKGSWNGSDVTALESLCKEVFGDKIFRQDEWSGGTYTVDQMKGKILLLLSGSARVEDNNGYFFIEDQGDEGRESNLFVAWKAGSDMVEKITQANEAGRLGRFWEFDGHAGDVENIHVPYRATDKPYISNYQFQSIELGAIPLLPQRFLDWEGSVSYDQGVDPSVALNDNNVVLELHKSQTFNVLYYNLGQAGESTINWYQQGVELDSGVQPSVALNNHGYAIEMHKSNNTDVLWYHVGQLSSGQDWIDWGSSIDSGDTGKSPSVAINDNGTVVEFHQSHTQDTLWYRVGILNTGQRTIDWGSPHQYDTGQNPAVALNNNGRVVEVHEAPGDNAVWSTIGRVDRNNKTIVFEDSTYSRHTYPYPYDYGRNPDIALRNNGQSIEVHKSEDFDTIWSRVGQEHGVLQVMQPSIKYDNGVSPSVAVNENGRVVEVHKSQSTNGLWYHVGSLEGGNSGSDDTDDDIIDDGGNRPPVPSDHGKCRPDGLDFFSSQPPLYCLVYQGDGREWLGEGRSRRVIGYFNSARTGENGQRYLASDIPWSSLTHINYAFAHVDGNHNISVGENNSNNPAIGMEWSGVSMDESLSYRGHFNMLAKYKKKHPRVKILISVGGWAESVGFYNMLATESGGINYSGILAFAQSTANFLRSYSFFDGVDIDFEYPSILADAGNPEDWGAASPRRAVLPDAYHTLMMFLRYELDEAGIDDGRYYLLTSATSASGYTLRGMENQKALRWQDFANLMSYDFHGSWNEVVAPNAPLYDSGVDPELVDLYNTPEYGQIGYFNTDWAFHYMRGAMQAGRINIGIPYYTRGWKNVNGGSNGLWGSAPGSNCEPGTGTTRPCGDGAVGIDNIWGGDVEAGVNPMWHAKNLENNVFPNYASREGLDPENNPEDQLSGTYARHWDNTTRTSWLWNANKQTFLSIFDTQSLDAVTDYVKAKGAGGVMMWELSGDYHCPNNVTGGNPCRQGNTLTNRLKDNLSDAGIYGASRNTGSRVTMPSAALDVSIEFVKYTDDPFNLWPLTPTVRISNHTDVTLGGDKNTRISFDIPTSTSDLVKDEYWQSSEQGGQWQIASGHNGSNVGSGLDGVFHRVTVQLDYCQMIPAGKSLNIPIIYYLPITGPVNSVVHTGGGDYAILSERNRGSSESSFAAGGCSAGNWDSSKVYNPSIMSVEEFTVKYDGQIWQAKWWTQNNIPGTGADSDHEPWKLIGMAE